MTISQLVLSVHRYFGIINLWFYCIPGSENKFNLSVLFYQVLTLLVMAELEERTVTISGVKVVFPCKPYPSQFGMMDRVSCLLLPFYVFSSISFFGTLDFYFLFFTKNLLLNRYIFMA